MRNFFIMILLGGASSYVMADRFEEGNSAHFFKNITGVPMVMDFNDLPDKGEQFDDRYGWSETYWPSNRGGIAFRWSHPDPRPFRYRLHTREELLKMNMEELSRLSPAEMYDIAMGDYAFTLTKKTLSRFNSRDLWWEGICHGWAQAATNYPEPAAVVVSNPDGIRVPFGASDVKALLSMHEAYNYGGAFAFTGRRCKVSGKVEGEGDERDRFPNPPAPELANSPDCKDVNAGAFHLVLTNLLGIHGRGFVADVDRYNDVWNQPVTSYSSRIISEESVSGAEGLLGISRKLRISTTFTYGEELKFYSEELAAKGIKNFVSKKPVTGTVHQEFRHKNYEYLVELDPTGNIIGGEWISETRPDFLWMFQRSKKFRNSPMPLGGLGKIYRPLRR
jgi:hypothetical protein